MCSFPIALFFISIIIQCIYININVQNEYSTRIHLTNEHKSIIFETLEIQVIILVSNKKHNSVDNRMSFSFE